MADVKISELTALTSPSGGEELVVNASGTTKKITIANATSASLPKAGGTMTGVIAGFESTGIDDNATSTAVTIDASENVLVGTTATSGFQSSSSATGTIAYSGGAIASNVSGDAAAYFNRLGSDGAIVNLRKSGTSVGSIQSRSGVVSTIILDPRTNGVGLSGTANAIIPTRETGAIIGNEKDLGASGIEFRDLYLSGGVYLGGTAAANKLDDYEEGTATISYTPASGSITMFYNTARYVKIGQLVFMEFSLSCNGASSPSGTVKLTGLPFTANGTGGLGVAGTGGAFGGYQFPTDQTNVTVYNGSTEAYITDATSNYLQASEMGFGYNAGQGGFSFTYRTNS